MFVAKKLCKFGGHKFGKNEPIPTELIHETAITRLIRCGVIAEVEGEGPLLPSLTSLEDNPAMEDEESEVEMEAEETEVEEETPEEEAEEQVDGIEEDWRAEFTEENLMKKKRDELIEIADALGIQFDKEDKDITKAIITKAILEEVQEITEGEE